MTSNIHSRSQKFYAKFSQWVVLLLLYVLFRNLYKRCSNGLFSRYGYLLVKTRICKLPNLYLTSFADESGNFGTRILKKNKKWRGYSTVKSVNHFLFLRSFWYSGWVWQTEGRTTDFVSHISRLAERRALKWWLFRAYWPFVPIMMISERYFMIFVESDLFFNYHTAVS